MFRNFQNMNIEVLSPRESKLLMKEVFDKEIYQFQREINTLKQRISDIEMLIGRINKTLFKDILDDGKVEELRLEAAREIDYERKQEAQENV